MRADACSRSLARTVISSTLALMLVVGGPAAASGAESYEDYVERVAEAAELARSSTTRVPSDADAQALADEIDRLLPGSETVVVDGEEVDVDNAVVRALTVKLAVSGTPESRRVDAERLAEHLTSLERAVVAPSGEPAREDPDALAELLTAEEREPPGWFQELMRRVFDWLGSLFSAFDFEPSEGGRTVVQVVLAALTVGLVALLFWLLSRVVRTRRGRERTELDDDVPSPVVAAAEGLPDDPLAYAGEMASRGEYRDAVRVLFGGAARELVRVGLVRQTRTLTNGELLRTVGRTGSSIRPALASLAADFELAWYGHVDPGQAGYAAAVERYRDVISTARSLGQGPSGGEGS